MVARLCAFVVWALVAATAVFWGLRLTVRALPTPATAVAVGDAAALRVDLSRLLGAAPVAAAAPAAAAVEVSARFRLLGIMAARPSTAANHDQGLALIAVDGKLPRAYPVGSAIDADLVLQSVSLRSAAIGPARGAPIVTLELPPLPAPATGTLPVPGAAFAPAAMVPGAPGRIAPPPVATQIMPTPPAGIPQNIVPLPPRDVGAPTQ